MDCLWYRGWVHYTTYQTIFLALQLGCCPVNSQSSVKHKHCVWVNHQWNRLTQYKVITVFSYRWASRAIRPGLSARQRNPVRQSHLLLFRSSTGVSSSTVHVTQREPIRELQNAYRPGCVGVAGQSVGGHLEWCSLFPLSQEQPQKRTLLKHCSTAIATQEWAPWGWWEIHWQFISV